MFTNESENEKKLGEILEHSFQIMYQICKDPRLSLDERERKAILLQTEWPKIRRLMVMVRTEKVNKP